MSAPSESSIAEAALNAEIISLLARTYEDVEHRYEEPTTYAVAGTEWRKTLFSYKQGTDQILIIVQISRTRFSGIYTIIKERGVFFSSAKEPREATQAELDDADGQ